MGLLRCGCDTKGMATYVSDCYPDEALAAGYDFGNLMNRISFGLRLLIMENLLRCLLWVSCGAYLADGPYFGARVIHSGFGNSIPAETARGFPGRKFRLRHFNFGEREVIEKNSLGALCAQG